MTIGLDEIGINGRPRLKAERDENTCRKDLSPSEQVTMAKALEPYEKKTAKKRQSEAGRSKAYVNVTQASKGPSSDKIASAVGSSRPRLTKATAVVRAAEAQFFGAALKLLKLEYFAAPQIGQP